MTGNICVYGAIHARLGGIPLTDPAGIVRVDQILTLITARRATLATSLPACALFVLGMTPTSKHGVEWSS